MSILKKGKSLFLWDGCVFWPAVYLTTRILYWCEPWHAVPIERFDRVMGQATQADLLVSGRTGQALLTVLVWVPLLLLAAWLLLSFCFGPGRRQEHRRKFTGWLSAFSGIGMVGMTMDYISQFGTEEDIWLYEAQAVPLVIVLCTLLWCIYLRLRPESAEPMSDESVKQSMLCGLVLGFPIQILGRFPTYTAVISGLGVLVALILCMTMSKFSMSALQRRVRVYAGIPLLLMLPAMLLYLEIGNVLNQYGVFVGKNQGPLTLIALACIAASGIVSGVINYRLKDQYAECIAFHKPLPDVSKDWRNIWYPIVLADFALVAGYNELQTFVGSDFFERANRAVSVSGFLNFGQIPAVETHGAHMGVDYFGGIFWGLINGDALAACFTEYNGITLALTLLVFYYLLRRCVGADAALVAALVLPVMNTSHSAGDWYAHLAYLPVLILLWAIEKPGFGRYALYWASAAFSVLYRGDIGLAVGVATVLVLLVHTLLQWKLPALKLYFGSLACVGGGLAAILAALCLIKGINPISRLWEFLQLMAASNQNWAYEGIGIPGSAGLAWTFLITPLTVLAMTGVIIVRLLRKNVELRGDHWMFFVFAAAYYLNFPRTLVRHSLLENIPVYCLAMGMWTLALGVWLLWKDRAPERRPGGVLLPAMLMLSLLVSAMAFDGQILGSTSLFKIAHDRVAGGEILFPQLVTSNGTAKRVTRVKETVDRVVLPPEMVDTAAMLGEELDAILQDGETWLDFTNQSALYALLGRHSPVYVNQSPGLLSGDYTQECFIEQIEKQRDKVPVALLPQQNMLLSFNLDGVNNSLRYYRVAEYIYNNYVPYQTAGNFAIWVHPERLELLQPKDTGEEAEVQEQRLDLSSTALRAINAELTQENNTLVIKASGNDPQLDNFRSILSGNGLKGGRTTVTIYYTSDTAGRLQLFRAAVNRNYEEANSLTAEVQATDVESAVQFTFDWDTTTRLRLDTPPDSTFTITGIATDADIAVSNGYGYGSMSETHTYAMGAIPRLWGEQDEKRAWENPELKILNKSVGAGFEVPAELTGGENGRYVKLVIYSSAESKAALSLVQTGERQATYAVFNFNVAPGTHTYLVRVSCDSYWYSGDVNAVTYSGPGLRSISILDGD